MIKQISKFLFVFVLMISWIFSSWPQIFNFPPKVQEVYAESATYDTSSGSPFTWNAPTNVFSVDVECWGAGGAGGGNNTSADGAGGGGGGGYSKTTGVAVTPSTGYTVTIGAGGTGVGGADGNPGGDSSFVGDSAETVLAKGGQGGKAPVGGLAGAIGTGGQASAGTGVTKLSGGNGGLGSDSPFGSGGGGGGGAGDAADGGVGVDGGNKIPGAGGTGGTSGGGTGGAGGDAGVNGFPGTAPGGAGGGSGDGTQTGGAGADGKCILNWTPLTPITTITNDASEPSSVTIAPSAGATDLDYFTLETNINGDTMTAAEVTLGPAGAFNNIYQVDITDTSDVAQCTAVTNPASNTVTFSAATCTLGITTTPTRYKIRITPKTHSNMDAPPGVSYATIGTVTDFTTTNSQSGTDSGSATVTVDNHSPDNSTSNGGSAGNEQVTINYTNPADPDADLHSIVVLRHTSAVVDVPAEGTTYTVGNTISGGVATVVCVDTTIPASTADSCVDTTSVINGTPYYYEIFIKDSQINYSTGAVPDGLPFTPSANSLPEASGVSIDSGALSITLAEGTTKNVVCFGSVTDNDGYANIQAVGAYFFRTSTGTSTPNDENERYYLYGDSYCVPSGETTYTEDYTCTFAVQYYADPTDGSSPYSGDDWSCEMWPEDSVATGTVAVDTIEMDSTAALDVTSSISYGTLDPDTDTFDVNQTTTVTNTGNVDMDPQIKGTNMTCSGNTLLVGQQQFSATPFTYSAGNLTTSDQTLDLTLPQRTSTVITDDVYWGIGIPDGTMDCTPYEGTNTFTAIPGI